MQIYRLGTMLETPGAITTLEREQDEGWQLLLFLRMHNLVSHSNWPSKKEDLGPEFKIMTDDLTEEGFAVLKEGFYKWLDSNDDINRTGIKMDVLEKALEKVRKS